MDGFQFTSSVIRSLAWPVTLIAGFFILKKHLGSMSELIDYFKFKEFEVKFKQSLNELSVKSNSKLVRGPTLEQDSVLQSRLYALSEISPRSAILEAWLQVETAAAEALQNHDLDFHGKVASIAPLRLGEYLKRLKIINQTQLDVFHGLRELRNKAVHIGDATIQPQEVTDYIKLAIRLASQIRRRDDGD